MKRKIVLASRSPRRRDLLKQIGLEFEIRESKYDEDMTAMDDPRKLVKFLALKKGEEVARHYKDAIIISGDTFVIFNNKFIGKPKNKEEAKKVLKNFSNKTHSIVSGFALIDAKTKKVINDYGEAKVKFRDLSEAEIDNYIATGEPFDMAGSYGLMNRAAVLIKGVEGDFYSVIGLPLNKVYLALKELGVDALKK